MEPVQLVLLGILLLCIGASGFFSGSETAIVALPRERIGQLAERGARGHRLAQLAEDVEGTLATLLLANNFVNILAASIATTLAIDLTGALLGPSRGEALGPWAATFVVTAVVLVFGEITPKTVAARRPDQFALVVAPSIWWIGRVLEPVALVFSAVARRLLRILGITGQLRGSATEEDILALALLSEEAGEIDPAEREMLQSVFLLADRAVREVMTPRMETIALESGSDREAVRRAVAAHRHSRFPVVAPGGNLDDIVGILYVKDVLGRPEAVDGIDAFVRQPVYIPESASVLAALQHLRRQRTSMGVVLDEHGGVDGIVTVKDLVAELVGEIQDEHDPREPSIHRLGERVWLVEGRVAVEDLCEETAQELPDGPYTSVGGLYLWAAGEIPEVGDRIEIGGVRFTVLRMDRRRIDRLRVEVVEEAAPRATGG